MTRQQRFHIFSLLCILIVLVLQNTSCSKDYSYEGGLVSDTTSNGDTTITNKDTTIAPDFYLPACLPCFKTDDVKPNTWMFIINGTVICGNVTSAIKNLEGTAMTFFGPSACSQDTGLVMTAYFVLPVFTANTANQVAQRVAFEHYDNLTPSQITAAQFTSPFSLTIENYTQQTGEAKGSFNGLARTANGQLVTISDGKFKITFR